MLSVQGVRRPCCRRDVLGPWSLDSRPDVGPVGSTAQDLLTLETCPVLVFAASLFKIEVAPLQRLFLMQDAGCAGLGQIHPCRVWIQGPKAPLTFGGSVAPWLNVGSFLCNNCLTGWRQKSSVLWSERFE